MIRVCLLVLASISFATGRWFVVRPFLQQSAINSLTVIHCYRDGLDRDVPALGRQLQKSFAGPMAFIDIGGSTATDRAYPIPISIRSMHRLGLILNLECANSGRFLQHASRANHFNSSYRWLFFGYSHDVNQVKPYFVDLNINIDASITLAIPHKNTSSSYGIYEVYGSVKVRGGLLNVEYLGNSTPSSGWLKTNRRKRDNLHQINLKVAVWSMNRHQPRSIGTYLSTLPTKPTSYSTTSYGFQLMKLLQENLNFSVKYILVSSWRLDVMGTNSSLGLIGQLQSKQVDISMVPLALTTERIMIFDPTIEITRSKFFTLFRHPRNALERNIFLQPFESTIWIATVLLLGCIAALLCVIFVVRKASADPLPTAILLTLGILAQQTVTAGRTGIASEWVLFVASFAFCMMLLQFYSSFIIGYQLTQPPRTINTMEQLMATGMSISIENMSYNVDFFMRTKDPVAIELYRKRIQPNSDGFQNISTGLDRVRQGGHAFHCDTSYGYAYISDTFNEKQICQLHHVLLYQHRITHIPVAKGSPLKELFKLQLQIMRESGVLAYQQARYFASRPQCIKDNHHMEPVELFDVMSAFVLLAGGVVLSGLVLVVELIFQWVRARYGRHNVPANFVWID